MERLIDLGSHRVTLYWHGDLGQDVEIFAVATNLYSACVAVELLLDELDLRSFWYGKEVIMEDGVFKVVLQEGTSHWDGWERVKRLAFVSRYRP